MFKQNKEISKMHFKFLLMIIITIGQMSSNVAQNFVDNFSSENIGDFPTRWNLLQGTAQVEQVDGSKVIKLGKQGTVTPLIEGDDYLGDQFTFEVDLYFDQVKQSLTYQSYNLRLWSGVSAGYVKNDDKNINFRAIKIYRYGIVTSYKTTGPEKGREYSNNIQELKDYDPVWRHLTLEYDHGKLKLFLDGKQVLNIPNYEFNPTMVSIEGNSNNGKGELVKAIDNVVISGLTSAASNSSIAAAPTSGPRVVDIEDVNDTPKLISQNDDTRTSGTNDTDTANTGIISEQNRESVQGNYPAKDILVNPTIPEDQTEEFILNNPTITKEDIVLDDEDFEEEVLIETREGDAPDIDLSALNYTEAERIKIFDDFVKNEMIIQDLPGLALGVYKEGVIDFTKGYGHVYFDQDRKTPITKNTSFRWASISKTLTSVVAHQVLVQDASFKLDDKAAEYIPYFVDIPNSPIDVVADSERKKKITIRQLVTNTSGMPHYGEGLEEETSPDYVTYNSSRYVSDNDNFNAASSAMLVSRIKLAYDPGTDYLYSSNGFNILGSVLDAKTGSYPNWVETNIKNKLGLTSLKISNGIAVGFTKPKDGIKKSNIAGSVESKLPSGGWESDVVDLVKFGRGIIEDKLLLNTTSLLTTKDFSFDEDYRRGIYSIKEENDFRIYHGGSHPSTVKTLLYMMPDEKIVIGIMIPVGYAEPYNLMRKILIHFGKTRNLNKRPINKCLDGMGNSSKQFAGVWAKIGGEDVVLRRGYTRDNFFAEWKFLASAGYYLQDLDYSNSGWSGIFKNGGTGPHSIWLDLSPNGFNDRVEKEKMQGLTLYDIEANYKNGQTHFSGGFKKQAVQIEFASNLTSDGMGNEYRDQITKGFHIIDVEPYLENGQLLWAGIWAKGSGNIMNRNMTDEDFKNKYNQYYGSYQLLDIEVYRNEMGQKKYAAIWKLRDGVSDFTTREKNWCSFLDFNKDRHSQGYVLMDIEEFDP